MTESLRKILLDAMHARIVDEPDRFSHLADIAHAEPDELEQMVVDNMFGVIDVMREELRRHYCDVREKCGDGVDGLYTKLLVALPKWAPWAVRKKWIEYRTIRRRVREVMARNWPLRSIAERVCMSGKVSGF